MKYIDVSSTTQATVTSRRTFRRRGIVLHETIGTYSLSWLQGVSALRGRPASSDFLINRPGDIYQLTRPGWYAYHTGTARWQLIQDPDYTINQSFIGIEFENNPQRGQKLTDLQYIAGAALIRALVASHELHVSNIVGHYQVALPRGRKSDPLTLDWAIMTRELMAPSSEGNDIVFPAVLP